jgi:hypothetical protein
MRKIIFATIVALLAISHTARAEIQTSGPETFPGKLMFGVKPLGVELLFNDAWVGRYGTGYVYTVGDRTLYKLALDFSGIIYNGSKVTLWLGGEVNVGGRGYLAFLEPGIFVQITLEKLLKIPLVPMVRVGISGPLYIPYGYAAAELAGAAQVKVGAGLYYFILPKIGLGADTNFAFGPGFTKDAANNVAVSFSGYWDFTLGARFVF